MSLSMLHWRVLTPEAAPSLWRRDVITAALHFPLTHSGIV
jgi:hypothetical protein